MYMLHSVGTKKVFKFVAMIPKDIGAITLVPKGDKC
jgi:hypothetical protein